MSDTKDKASGLPNVAVGKIKQSIGSTVGSDKLVEQGADQDLKGLGQRALGETKASANAELNATEDRELRIRERAYELWLQEGRPDGLHHEHWRQAEIEIDA